MTWPLFDRLPPRPAAEPGSATAPGPSAELILDGFLDFIREKGLDLYPAQEEAVLELLDGKNVILNTPTGSGKSLVALALHFHSLAHGRRSYYTSPIKALVNEKFLALCRDFGPDQVGMVTGDATVNADAPIICCTAEILMNDALRDGANADIQDVVMDEFHYYSDRERGVAWQVPLLALLQTRFLLMSATLGDTAPFEEALTQLNGKPTVVVRSTERPVPLDFQYSEDPLHDAVAKLIRAGRAPIYLVSFTQRECAEEAQNFMSVDLCTKEEKKTIAEALEGFKFSSPYGKELQKFLRHGMGIHHAGLLPKYRVLVEKLAQKGLMKIIFGTDTLGVGVNVPIRSVLMTKLCKFDGEKTAILSVRDFQQICGRAGRRGYDNLGTVVIQAPEHVIENLRNEQKAAGDAKKLKKLVKRKPPEKGYVAWNQETFQRLVNGQPEALVSRFKVTHAMLLNVLSRPDVPGQEDGCRAMRSLIRDSHESDSSKKRLRKTAFQLFRSLVDRKIIEFNPLRINVDLQEDFSLNHALSLYLIDTLKLLSPSEPTYALDVLTLVESILEDPELILRKQLDRIKTEKMQELKASGMEYDQRIEELEKLEYPKPNRDFIYDTFNAFAAAHPWVGQENISPKSIAREMYEVFHTFPEYVREYDLHRAEGLLLRYLSEVYKALIQNVPEYAMNDELYEISVYFGSMIRQIDSSLIDEWERMRDPAAFSARETAAAAADAVASGDEKSIDITRDKKAFTVLIRNEAFRIIKALARRDYEGVIELLGSHPDEKAGPSGTSSLTSKISLHSETHLSSILPTGPNSAPTSNSSLAAYLEARMKEYYESAHAKLSIDQKARAPEYFKLELSESGADKSGSDADTWKVQQLLTDPDGHNDWALDLEVDLAISRAESRPVLRLTGIGPL